jgi:hypothetical protein
MSGRAVVTSPQEAELGLAAAAVAAVAVLVGIAMVAWLGWAVGAQHHLASHWRDWQLHQRSVSDAIYEDAAVLASALRQGLRHLGAGDVGSPVRVSIKGSAWTGAARKGADVDIVVEVLTCDLHDRVVQALISNHGCRHVHSGGRFTLLATKTPGGRDADVSVSGFGDSGLPARRATNQHHGHGHDHDPDPAPRPSHARARGFFEHIVRTRHPDCTIREFQ